MRPKRLRFVSENESVRRRAASLDANGEFVRRDTVETPRVTIGGVEQQVLFFALSPQFVGVYQLNVLIA